MAMGPRVRLNLANDIVVVLGLGVSALAQSEVSAIGSSLIQLGAIGVVLAWITLVDIPQRNKAAEKREDLAEKAADKREAAWEKQLVAERLSSQAREEMFRASLDKMSAALDKLGNGLNTLSEELQDERRSRT